MNGDISHKDQPIPCIQHEVEGQYLLLSLKKHLILWIKRTLGFKGIRVYRRKLDTLLNFISAATGKNKAPVTSKDTGSQSNLKPGDWVRVLSEKEIKATLNHVHQLKGCSFIPEMAQFCGTLQRVLKPVERLVDERDLRVLKPKGIVLLLGVTCKGGEFWGICDRECYYFWRQEWLEKIN